MPTISFRDLAIQRRENDLVGASFGRGFFVFDDYSPLREVSEEQLKKEATLFPTRKAWWYIQKTPLGGSEKGSQGASYYTAPNPPFGVVFTYYLAEGLKTKESIRKEKEKEQLKKNVAVKFPGWEKVEAERRQEKSMIWLTVKDDNGNVVRRIKGPVTKGFHRVAWDLRFASTYVISEPPSGDDEELSGVLAAPGNYTVTLSKQVDGVITNLSEPMSFKVEQMRKGALTGASPAETAAFWQQIAQMQKDISAASLELNEALKKVEILKTALARTTTAPGDLDKQLFDTKQALLDLDEQLNGNRSKQQVGEKTKPNINYRLGVAVNGTMNSTYGPTPTHKRSLEIAQSQLTEFKSALNKILNEQLPRLEKALLDAGASFIK